MPSPFSLQQFFTSTLRRADRLLPAPCLLCGCALPAQLSPALICTYCRHILPELRRANYLCQCCALPLPSDAPTCGECLVHQPAFTTAVIPFRYAYPVDLLIHKFKYRHQLSSGQLLGELFVQQLPAANLPDCLVPVPIHWTRRWQRGFNQAEILAHTLGAKLHLPVVHACKLPRQLHRQKDLGRRARLQNRRNAFVLANEARELICNAHIALVDDVVTTTATARALSELLRKHGAKRVDIWALARTCDSEDDHRSL